MKYVVLTLVMLLAACVPTKEYHVEITRPDVIYVSDSACWKVFDVEEENILDPNDHYRWDRETKSTAQNMTGIVSNCVPRRQLMQYGDSLPQGYRVVFLALGTNDVDNQIDINAFRDKYQRLVDSSNADILNCVLPNTVIRGKSATPYINVIRSICSNVIDPRDYGVRFRAKDTVHWNELDHRLAVNMILYNI